MDNTTILVAEDKQPNRKRVRQCIPLNQLFRIKATELWPLDTALSFVKLWNSGKSIQEIARVLDPPNDARHYKPAQVVSKATNIIRELEIREKKCSENLSKPKRDKQSEQKERECLMCQEKFMSSWAGERICKTCKQLDIWYFGYKNIA